MVTCIHELRLRLHSAIDIEYKSEGDSFGIEFITLGTQSSILAEVSGRRVSSKLSHAILLAQKLVIFMQLFGDEAKFGHILLHPIMVKFLHRRET